MNFEKAKIKTQAEANETQKRIAVINVNRFSPQYVLRSLPENMTFSEAEKDRGVAFIAPPEA